MPYLPFLHSTLQGSGTQALPQSSLSPLPVWSILEVGLWEADPGQRADGEGRAGMLVPSSSAYWSADWDSRPQHPTSLCP